MGEEVKKLKEAFDTRALLPVHNKKKRVGTNDRFVKCKTQDIRKRSEHTIGSAFF